MSIFFGTAISKHKEGMDYWLCQSAILVSSTKFYLAGNFSAANKGIMEGIVEMARKGDIPKVILMRVFRLQCISAISLGPEGVLKKVGLLD